MPLFEMCFYFSKLHIDMIKIDEEYTPVYDE